jgi:uncharacterized coiled-coil protein SlyX
MAKIDWDWLAELALCESKIIELEIRVASQKQKIELLLNRGMDAALAQRVLILREQNLELMRSFKHLIENRIAERAAGPNSEAPSSDEPHQSTEPANDQSRDD